ncbi:unnamed protein product [Periconia digitata]|uniref:Heavy metal tolerance protein n=1 Tax=Periconia digitata TaxID=1303443 RepID=A0A9W4U9H6_9PLEO|nr:unnamed protein product [Periconia digitata]
MRPTATIMAQPPSDAAWYTTMVVMDYMQAPLVALYYLGATSFALCVLHKAKPVRPTPRRIAAFSSVALLVAYFAETIYYLSRHFADARYSPPQHAAVRCLGSMLLWIPLSSNLLGKTEFIWHPYFGAFVGQFVFETAICMFRRIALSQDDRWSNVPFSLSTFRAVASLVLLIDGFVILIKKVAEKGTKDEEQSLLGAQPTDSTAPNGNSTTEYGSIDQANSDDEDENHLDKYEKELQEQQAKRLAEQGGWIGYLKSFTVFIPYLWPKDDWKVMGCLAIRLVHLLASRALNLLVPRQLGIITNKLTMGATVMPWHDIFLWALYSWLDSYGGLGFIDSLADIYIGNSAFERITILAYNHVMSLGMDFHTSKDSGEVLKAVEQASSLNSLVELVLFDILPIWIDLFVAMYYVTHLFDVYMAFMLLFMGMTYIWIGVYATTLTQPKRRSYVEKARSESTTVNETVHNWQTVAYFNRTGHERERYRANIRATIQAGYDYYFRSMGGHAAQDYLINFGYVGCCCFAMSQIISGEKPIGSLVTFMMYWGTITGPMYVMAGGFRHISNILIDAERLLQLLTTKPSVSDREDAKDLVVKEGKVEFDGVDFAYDPRKQIIKNATLTAEGGQTVAFVGETGGGKSTMLKLLFRFYDITSGSIVIDGQDLRSVTISSLRESIGLVPQDPALFNQTIRTNIRYAKLDATDAEVEDACRAAAIHDDIISFPDGYNAKVGERGVRLSGGQLQRIAIARVLLKNPKIVMLDEATSAVDSAIEAKIQEAFQKLSKGRTTFVIAHRLSTIVDANLICVIEKGEIIERGTHNELLLNGGKYYELWTKQTTGAAQTAVASKAGSSKAASVKDEGEPLIDITPSEDQDEATATGKSDGGDGGGSVSKRK